MYSGVNIILSPVVLTVLNFIMSLSLLLLLLSFLYSILTREDIFRAFISSPINTVFSDDAGEANDAATDACFFAFSRSSTITASTYIPSDISFVDDDDHEAWLILIEVVPAWLCMMIR